MRRLLVLWFAVAPTAGATDLPPRFEAGPIEVVATLRSPETQGWTTTGAGRCGSLDQSPYARFISGEHATQLRWAADSPGTLLQARGGMWSLSDLTLLGRPTNPGQGQESEAPHSGVGVLVDQRGAFNGAKANLSRVAFGYFADAVRVGAKPADHGNDNLGMDDLLFAHCDHALTLAASQSMHHTATRWHVRRCGAVLNVEAGGKFDLRGLDTDCHGCLVRTVGDGRRIGPNNGVYTLSHVTVDNAGDRLTLVDEGRNVWLRVTIDGLYMPALATRKTLDATLRGKDSLLRLSRIENLPRDTRLRLLDGARCLLTSSDLPGDPSDLLTDDSRGVLVVRDCWLNGEPVNETIQRTARRRSPSR